MQQLDFKKEFKTLYNPSAKEVKLVEVPDFSFLMIDGMGDPNTAPSYQLAVETLYSLSYNLKFGLKKAGLLDYTVGPLEGLWWTDSNVGFDWANKARWQWTMLIMQPAQVTAELLAQALEQVAQKKKAVSLPPVRLETLREGQAAQVLYLGPYADEGPTIKRLHDFITEQGYQLACKHHEIYLSDPRRTAPEKLKTILRQPVALSNEQ